MTDKWMLAFAPLHHSLAKRKQLVLLLLALGQIGNKLNDISGDIQPLPRDEREDAKRDIFLNLDVFKSFFSSFPRIRHLLHRLVALDSEQGYVLGDHPRISHVNTGTNWDVGVGSLVISLFQRDQGSELGKNEMSWLLLKTKWEP